jgi:predicted nucleic acid-binding protein
MRFVDANILLYSLSTHSAESAKAEIARRLLDDDDLCLSVQVLQEFHVQATRPSRRGALSHDEAVALVQTWLRFPVQEITVALMRNAFAASARWHLSYWDAAVIEAARLQGCGHVLSEDLSAGQDYGGVRVTNPFA